MDDVCFFCFSLWSTTIMGSGALEDLLRERKFFFGGEENER